MRLAKVLRQIGAIGVLLAVVVGSLQGLYLFGAQTATQPVAPTTVSPFRSVKNDLQRLSKEYESAARAGNLARMAEVEVDSSIRASELNAAYLGASERRTASALTVLSVDAVRAGAESMRRLRRQI